MGPQRVRHNWETEQQIVLLFLTDYLLSYIIWFELEKTVKKSFFESAYITETTDCEIHCT